MRAVRRGERGRAILEQDDVLVVPCVAQAARQAKLAVAPVDIPGSLPIDRDRFRAGLVIHQRVGHDQPVLRGVGRHERRPERAEIAEEHRVGIEYVTRILRVVFRTLLIEIEAADDPVEMIGIAGNLDLLAELLLLAEILRREQVLRRRRHGRCGDIGNRRGRDRRNILQQRGRHPVEQ